LRHPRGSDEAYARARRCPGRREREVVAPARYRPQVRGQLYAVVLLRRGCDEKERDATARRRLSQQTRGSTRRQKSSRDKKEMPRRNGGMECRYEERERLAEGRRVQAEKERRAHVIEGRRQKRQKEEAGHAWQWQNAR